MDKSTLEDYLREKGKTKSQLARELGYSREHVTRQLNQGEPTEPFLWRFYQTYGQDETVRAFDPKGK